MSSIVFFRTARGDDAFRRGFVAVVMVACVCLNALLPRLALRTSDREFFQEVMAQQTDLFYFFSFSSLPVTIMNSLIGSPAALAESAKKNRKPLPATPADTAGVAADHAFPVMEKKTAVKSGPSLGGSAADQQALFSPKQHCLSPPVLLMLFRSWHARLYLFMPLVFFFLLPRSAINEEADTKLPVTHGTRHAFACRVFFFC